MEDRILYKDLSYKIVGLAMQAHRELGPGFLEKVYENALMVYSKRTAFKLKRSSRSKFIFTGELWEITSPIY